MVTWVSPEVATVLFNELRARAPRLLEDSGFKTATEYQWHSRAETAHLIRYTEGIVIVKHWYRGLRAEVHPAIWSWRVVRQRLPWFLSDIMAQLGVQRLDLLLRWPSRTLRKALACAGARFEGTARKSSWSYANGATTLIDVDIWSILQEDLQGDLHG